MHINESLRNNLVKVHLDSETSMESSVCLLGKLFSLEEIKEMHELQTLQNFPSVVYTSVGHPPFVLD